MIKVSLFPSVGPGGQTVFPLQHRVWDGVFEKTAAPTLLPGVSRFISGLRAQNGTQDVLVNALGAQEYFGSNSNGDGFCEEGLRHAPEGWTENPEIDRELSRRWPYGYPTFYNAHVFVHHRNKDPNKAVGEVLYSAWHPHMKRVELVLRFHKDLCERFGGMLFWDRMARGELFDVSMGCFCAGTRVTMFDGHFVPIEQIRVGDEVLTHAGKPEVVEQLQRYIHHGSIFHIKAYGHRSELILTGNHPLWLVRAEQLTCVPSAKHPRRQRHCTPLVRGVSRGCVGCSTEPSYRFEWTPAEEAQVGDYLAMPVPMDIDETISDPREAKLLGYYLAEGYVRDYNRNRPFEQIVFSLGFEEKDIAEEIEQLSRALGASVVWHEEKPEFGARSVSVVSKVLADRCLRFCGMYEPHKQLSLELLRMAPELQRILLGAYLDGDGGTYRGSAYFSTASEQLSEQLTFVLARAGMVASVNKIDHKPSEKSVVRKETVEYQIWVGTDFSHVLGPYARKPVSRSKKVRGQRFFYDFEGTRYLMTPITEIVEDEDREVEVFNFAVRGDDSYVAERLAVHNSRVKFDCCSICTNWELFNKALATFDPKVHASPDVAILAYHKRLVAGGGRGIRGLAVTRADYCEHALCQMNRILPDGRKVFVHNPYANFFDISGVFIGADKTAKGLYKIAAPPIYSIPSALVAEQLGYRDDEVKTAAKVAEMDKNVTPTQFGGEAVPLVTSREPHLPQHILRLLAERPLDKVLGAATRLGIVFRPREFQRLMLERSGDKPLADALDQARVVFGREPQEKVSLGESDSLSEALLTPFCLSRSSFGPVLHKRLTLISVDVHAIPRPPSSLNSEPLRKIGSVYSGYRDSVMDALLKPNQQESKTGSGATITPLTRAYLETAYWDEVGVDTGHGSQTGVEKGAALQRTRVPIA